MRGNVLLHDSELCDLSDLAGLRGVLPHVHVVSRENFAQAVARELEDVSAPHQHCHQGEGLAASPQQAAAGQLLGQFEASVAPVDGVVVALNLNRVSRTLCESSLLETMIHSSPQKTSAAAFPPSSLDEMQG